MVGSPNGLVGPHCVHLACAPLGFSKSTGHAAGHIRRHAGPLLLVGAPHTKIQLGSRETCHSIDLGALSRSPPSDGGVTEVPWWPSLRASGPRTSGLFKKLGARGRAHPLARRPTAARGSTAHKSPTRRPGDMPLGRSRRAESIPALGWWGHRSALVALAACIWPAHLRAFQKARGTRPGRGDGTPAHCCSSEHRAQKSNSTAGRHATR